MTSAKRGFEPETTLPARIAAVRRFNRFYTRRIGVLQEGFLRTAFSLTEGRVLYELAHREAVTASALARDLDLDPGYLSRILKGFEARGLITRAASVEDARQSLLSLTPAGRAAFAPLDRRSQEEIGGMLEALPVPSQKRLVAQMAEIESMLGEQPAAAAPYLLRPHRPGDLGWIVHRHGALYAEEYGWDESFEALVAEIAAKFLREFDPRRERCWIAEREGEILGSVRVVRQSDEVAKLRLLLVEPKARGLGLGRRLVEECLRFARLSGYRRMTLWTNDILHAARRIYEQAGFHLTAEEPHRSFGHDLVSQTWERDLAEPG
ncbi:MAG TPA: helix-turn-helix domain-containing GNAT family N-acetyltransferase [Dongiaceae bacterium]|nr:helix-turn-helix domain-containing GNAT family N-acetyltransferase [Dongiaceae bacterium]